MLLLHLFGTMSLWLKWLARRRPLEFFRQIKGVLITAFSTSSSSATLPAALAVGPRGSQHFAIDCRLRAAARHDDEHERHRALRRVCRAVHRAGLRRASRSLQQITLVFLSVLSAVAVAAIPGGSLPLVAGLLVAFGIPPEGIGIILGVDRILDMTRTMTNVGSDLVTTAVVDAAQKKSAPARFV